jgi:hypothetical protein
VSSDIQAELLAAEAALALRSPLESGEARPPGRYVCIDCGIEGAGRADRKRCDPCRLVEKNAWAKRAYAADPEKYRRRRLRSRYGVADYDERLAAQGGTCAACRRPETKVGRWGTAHQLSVDHCHVSGRVRGLLCSRCNLILGKAEDSPGLLRSLADYLEAA